MLNDGEFYTKHEDTPSKFKKNFPETLFPLSEKEAQDLGVDMWYVPLTLLTLLLKYR